MLTMSRENGTQLWNVKTGQAQSTVPIDNSFLIDGTRWNGGGATLVLFKLINVQNRVAVCGAYLNDGSVPGNVDRRFMRSTRVKIKNRTIIGNLGFMPKLRKNKLENAKAHCKVTRHEWKASYATAEPKLRNSEPVFEY